MNEQQRKEIKSAVLDLLTTCKKKGIDLKLPVPVKAIVKSLPSCRLIPYSVQCKRRKISMQDMISYAGTIDACCDCNLINRSYIIYYNDLDPAITKSNRYRWNIAHELGHIVLNHHFLYDETRLFRCSLSEDAYRKLEEEADTFAAYLLVPHGAICTYSLSMSITVQWIQKHCKISQPAARYRYADYQQWVRQGVIDTKKHWTDSYDLKIARLFIKPRMCTTCGHVFNRKEDERYCPICGESEFIFGNGTGGSKNVAFEYAKVETDANGRVLECVQCGNKDFLPDSEYCQICGAPIVNFCQDAFQDNEYYQNRCQHTEPLPGNARYCPYCGTATSFYNKSVLTSWEEEKSGVKVQEIKDEDGFPLPF